MLFKILVIGLLGVILLSLSTALFSMIKDKGQSERTVKALTVRIVLSIGLIILLGVGAQLGLIQPHGVY
ncbi:MAG: twin transmembrane helix small protein [Thioalkalispiraceae bacterium]|jgi:formate/nitrite transporter FocA (FNT family)